MAVLVDAAGPLDTLPRGAGRYEPSGGCVATVPSEVGVAPNEEPPGRIASREPRRLLAVGCVVAVGGVVDPEPDD